MKSNFHTHTTFCDGKSTPEEIVVKAIEEGFDAIGFSGHGYTPFDLRYCMKDTEAYIAEIERLKGKYAKDIEILLGVEEDAFHLLERHRFDYVIGSSHYFCIGNEYFPIDSSHAHFKRCLELFDHDVISLAEAYYSSFLDYITKRRPDVIGHFDLITKFDELEDALFLNNAEYLRIADRAAEKALESGCLFEVNTGAIARGLRSSVYPHERLLHILKKGGAGLILSSDSHTKETLDYGFEDAKGFLRDMGFTHLYTLTSHGAVKYRIS